MIEVLMYRCDFEVWEVLEASCCLISTSLYLNFVKKRCAYCVRAEGLQVANLQICALLSPLGYLAAARAGGQQRRLSEFAVIQQACQCSSSLLPSGK